MSRYWPFLTQCAAASFSSTALQEADPLIASKPKSKRRPDIDIIRVGLTWGILLYHTVLIYVPYITYYVKDPFYNFRNYSTPGADVSRQYTMPYTHQH